MEYTNASLEFLGIVRGIRSNEILNTANLSKPHYVLSGKERTLVCMGIEGRLEHLTDWKDLGVKKGKPGVFANHFGLNPNLVGKWLKRFRNGLPLYDSDHLGQPLKINSIMVQSIINVIAVTPLGKRTSSEIDNIINKEYKKQAVASGNMTELDASAANDLDHRTVAKVRKQQIGNYRKPQDSTKARIESLACHRLAFHWSLSCLATFGVLPGFKKWNLDASGIQVKCVPKHHPIKYWS